jgi:hypothetical protein
MNINQKVTRFALCLGAFVAIYSPPVADPMQGAGGQSTPVIGLSGQRNPKTNDE